MMKSRLSAPHLGWVLGWGLFLHLLVLAGLALGAAPSDFSLRSPVDGRTFRLAEARGKYVALHFLLKTECPLCLKHTRDYTTRSASVPGVVQVFIKPDGDAEITAWATKLGGDGPTIYRDPDARLAKQFGIPHGYRFHGQVVHYPALVLLDPNGREVFRHVGKNNSDRFPFDKFAAKVAELKSAARK
jgi:peroxiredoxin Q/BCP